jgi:hypothetical protein
MRAAVCSAAALLVLAAAGCSSSPARQDAGTEPGCGLLGRERVVGLLGRETPSHLQGSVAGLRTEHRRLRCTNVDRRHAERFVTATATYHPKPYRLPSRSCDAGWVFAGSPDKYAPACQESKGPGRQSTTRLVVRWQPYLVTVTVSRLDRSWGGDPELALAMSRELARHLRVKEATKDR